MGPTTEGAVRLSGGSMGVGIALGIVMVIGDLVL